MSEAATPLAKAAESDLAYLRRLADAGRGEPAPFLLLMAVFGGAYGFSLLILLLGLVVEGGPKVTRDYVAGPIVIIANGLLLTSHLLFLLALIWTGWRTLGPKRVRLNRASAATWTAAFIGLVTVVAAVRLFARNEPPSDAVYSAHLLGSILLVLWGSAWWVTAITSDRRWLLIIAMGSFGGSVALAWVGNSPMAIPIICACLLLLAFVPAMLLMHRRGR